MEFEVLKEIEARLAVSRQVEAGGDRGNQHTGGKVPVVENLPQAAKPEPNGKARDKAAKKLNAGWSGKTAENTPG